MCCLTASAEMKHPSNSLLMTGSLLAQYFFKFELLLQTLMLGQLTMV